MSALLDTIVRVAHARTPVLIEGESGVGKELVAQHLHRASNRAAATFVDLNCAAVAENLFESELFGHEKGAFTGAGNEKPGLVEVADGGTLFLDEIGEMPAETQAKLLRVLDSGSFYRVGATRKRRADFRLVAATNRNLRDVVAAGRFREDLFYRLNGVGVVIPPLRERREDIPLLLEHFARQLPVKRRFAPSAVAALGAYAWPGNVRELALRGGADRPAHRSRGCGGVRPACGVPRRGRHDRRPPGSLGFAVGGQRQRHRDTGEGPRHQGAGADPLAPRPRRRRARCFRAHPAPLDEAVRPVGDGGAARLRVR